MEIQDCETKDPAKHHSHCIKTVLTNDISTN